MSQVEEEDVLSYGLQTISIFISHYCSFRITVNQCMEMLLSDFNSCIHEIRKQDKTLNDFYCEKVQNLRKDQTMTVLMQILFSVLHFFSSLICSRCSQCPETN